MRKILLLFILITIGTLNVNASTNPYPKTSSYGVNCTWYAWEMANSKVGISLPSWGNAKDWYTNAKNSGYSVGSTPKSNSIVVWGGWTSYGHVGYVESVEDNIIKVWDSTGPCIDEEDEEYINCMANGVSEESDKICKENAKRIACKYTISPDEYGITGYIYLDNAPKTNSTTTKKETEEKTTTKKKSNNTYLKNITLSSGNIDFKKDELEYNIEVPNEINIITISATPVDKNAQITGTGEHKLDIGLNKIEIEVKAEDESEKKYTINITRKEKEIIKTNKKIIKKTNKNTTNIMLFVIPTIIILTSIIFIVKKKKNK